MAGRNSHTNTGFPMGVNNIAIGSGAGFNIHGSNNTFLGRNAGGPGYGDPAAMAKVMSGNNNTFVGHDSGLKNASGTQNVFLGWGSGVNNVSGSFNISIGTSGPTGAANSNILLGLDAGTLTTGNNNLMLGNTAGQSLTTGNDNTFIGRVFIPSTAATATRYGNNTSGAVIISSGTDWQNQKLYIGANGYMGINLANSLPSDDNIPQNSLEIGAGISAPVAGTSGLRFRNYTSNSTAITNTSGKVLSLNSAGDVILVNEAAGAAACNIYSCDGAITTPSTPNADNPNPGLRTVTMGNNNLFFDTHVSSFETGTAGKGRIYIGNNLSFPNLIATAGIESQYRLLVEGGIMTEKVKVALRSSSTDWADYVFADNYKLMPLKEVAAFVEKNKHLPGIDSAEDLVNKGLDLGKMQAKQMEKIEELTLYVIKQDKEIEELKAQVKALLEKK